MPAEDAGERRLSRRAFRFVPLVGVLSFFADFTYEGSRSILGPFLAGLGASATIVGIVTGFGEFLGYGLRLVSGRLADNTGKYWPITIFGYVLQMSVVPALALAGSWPVAAVQPPRFRVRFVYRRIRHFLVSQQRGDRHPLRPVAAVDDRVLRGDAAAGHPNLRLGRAPLSLGYLKGRRHAPLR